LLTRRDPAPGPRIEVLIVTRFGILVIKIGPPLWVRLERVRANSERQKVDTTIIPRADLFEPETESLDHRPFADLQERMYTAEEEADVLSRNIRSRQHNVAFWITSDEAFFT
jgi:hypothetical protein